MRKLFFVFVVFVVCFWLGVSGCSKKKHVMKKDKFLETKVPEVKVQNKDLIIEYDEYKKLPGEGEYEKLPGEGEYEEQPRVNIIEDVDPDDLDRIK